MKITLKRSEGRSFHLRGSAATEFDFPGLPMIDTAGELLLSHQDVRSPSTQTQHAGHLYLAKAALACGR